MLSKKLFYALALLLLTVAALCGAASAEQWGGAFTSGGAENERAPKQAPLRAAADESYTQSMYLYETGAESRLWGPSVDWRGQYYYLKKNAAGTKSYIFQDYSPSNRTDPFITIDGDVASFEVTSDPDRSYVYYKLAGENALYRLPLVKGAAGPERRTFSLDGTGYDFNSFRLAQNQDEFLLYSSVDSGLNVRIGLFSFDGGPSPTKTWSAVLPQDWRNDWELDDDNGYGVGFESSTGKVWLVAPKKWHGNDGWDFSPWWFFSGNISEEGALSSYNPSSDIQGYNQGGNLQILIIGRYGRLVTDYDTTLPDPAYMSRIREFDAAEKRFKDGSLTAYTDESGNIKSLGDFLGGSDSGGMFYWDTSTDGQGNIYLKRTNTLSNGKTDWQRTAILVPPASSAVGTPVPDPSADNNAVFNPANIILKTALPSLPDGTTITGSRWEIYKASGANGSPAYVSSNADASAEHSVSATLPEGGYVWRVAYDWERTGSGDTVRGSTKFSREAPIKVSSAPPSTGGSSGGGCDAGLGMFGALILAGAAVIARKTRD